MTSISNGFRSNPSDSSLLTLGTVEQGQKLKLGKDAKYEVLINRVANGQVQIAVSSPGDQHKLELARLDISDFKNLKFGSLSSRRNALRNTNTTLANRMIVVIDDQIYLALEYKNGNKQLYIFDSTLPPSDQLTVVEVKGVEEATKAKPKKVTTTKKTKIAKPIEAIMPIRYSAGLKEKQEEHCQLMLEARLKQRAAEATRYSNAVDLAQPRASGV